MADPKNPAYEKSAAKGGGKDQLKRTASGPPVDQPAPKQPRFNAMHAWFDGMRKDTNTGPQWAAVDETLFATFKASYFNDLRFKSLLRLERGENRAAAVTQMKEDVPGIGVLAGQIIDKTIEEYPEGAAPTVVPLKLKAAPKTDGHKSPAAFLQYLPKDQFGEVLYHLHDVLNGPTDPPIPFRDDKKQWYATVYKFQNNGYTSWGQIATVSKDELTNIMGLQLGEALSLLEFIKVMGVPYPGDFWQQIMKWTGHPGDGAALVHNVLGAYAHPPLYDQLWGTQEKRFDFRKGIMERQLSRDVYMELHTMAFNADRSEVYLHLYGPAGIGKSHALYSAAIALRYKNTSLRVPYLPSCEKWGKEPMAGRYLISAFRDAFIDDADILEALGRVEAENEEAVKHFFNAELPQLLASADLMMLVMIDQINKIPKEHIHQFPYSMVSYMASSPEFKERGSLVCAGSTSSLAVRDDPLNIFKTWPKKEHYEGFPGGIKGGEFMAWWPTAFPSATQDQLEEVEALTNLIPNELKLLAVTMDMTKFDDSVQVYVLEKKKDIKLRTEEWVNTVLKGDPERKKSAARAAVFMHAEAQVMSITDYTTDERFMLPASRGKTVQRDDGPQHIRGVVAPLTPVIGEAIYEYWRDHTNDIVVNSIANILMGDYTQDTKGRLWEKIIIDGLAAKPEHGLRIEVVQIGKKSKVNLHIPKFDKVVTFRGTAVPTVAIGKELPGSRRVLFVPVAPNYPFVDVLLWDGDNNTLWALQITLCDPISDHEKPGKNTFFSPNVKGGRDLWAAEIKKATGRKPEVFELWVGTNDKTHAGWQADYFCHIEAFKVVEYPLLRECIGKVFG